MLCFQSVQFVFFISIKVDLPIIYLEGVLDKPYNAKVLGIFFKWIKRIKYKNRREKIMKGILKLKMYL